MAKKSKLNLEQLQELQKDYETRAERLKRQSEINAESGNFHVANDCIVRSEIYAIAARDIKNIIDGVVLYDGLNTPSAQKAKSLKILKAFMKA